MEVIIGSAIKSHVLNYNRHASAEFSFQVTWLQISPHIEYGLKSRVPEKR